jgi:hypothetical protein
MKKVKPLMLMIACMMLPLSTNTVYADTPETLMGAHGHGVTVQGKIILFRNQVQGLELGPENDRIDAETLVVLDSEPGKTFGIRHHENIPATQAIVDTLREAYLHDIPVTIQHVIAPGRKNVKINWVQLGDVKMK